MTRASGVYAIIHRDSGKLYVGSAVNISKRWDNHRFLLSGNRHHSRHLQRAWNKYGEGAFAFVVVRFYPRDDLIAEEQRWIDEMEATGQYGYNSAPTAGSVLGVKHTPEARAKIAAVQRGRKHTPEHIAKRVAGYRGRIKTPEERAKISASLRGKKLTPEHRAKVSASQRGRKRTPEFCAKISAALRARKRTPETGAKISAAKKGKKQTPEVIAKRKGREVTPETRAKLAAANRGKKHTPEAIANITAANRKGAAARKAAKLARMSMVQGELFN
jgi:group I intron endonuclease